MSDHNPHDEIADLIEGDASFDAPAPYPADVGDPEEWQGDDYDQSAVDVTEDERKTIPDETLRLCSIEPQNDTGNGQRLLHHFGDALLHVRNVGWHVWADTHWRAEGGDEIATHSAQRTAARIALEADFLAQTPIEKEIIEAADAAAIALKPLKAKAERTDSEKKEVIRLENLIEAGAAARGELVKRQTKRRAFAVSSGNSSRLMGMISQALPHRVVGPDALNNDHLKFNVENGTLRFKHEKIRDDECPDPDVERYKETWSVVRDDHARGDNITKVAPVVYDPKAECPRFMAFLDRFQPNLNIRKFLQTYHGYAMTGLTGEQCMLFNYGLGANGKSTFIDIIARIMGDYAQTLPFESLCGENGRRGDQATPDLARLPGARLVRASEPDGDVKLKEGLIKSLTGGEPMLVRHLHKGFFEFLPEFKLALSGNKKPRIIGVDHGIWRRIRLVPWSVTIADGDRRPIAEVLAEFWEERSGILNWLLAGAIDYFNNGLKVPKEIVDATASYRDEMDPLGAFIATCVDLVPGASETARDMYLAYCAWCEANSLTPWKETSFGLNMPQKGIERTDTRIRRYVNVRLHDVPESPTKSHSASDHPAPSGESGDDDVPNI